MECLRIRPERKKHIFPRFGARISDLSLHLGSVALKKGNSVAIPMQKGIVNLVCDGLFVRCLRIIETVQGGKQTYEVGKSSCAARVEAKIFEACFHSFFVLPQIGVIDP